MADCTASSLGQRGFLGRTWAHSGQWQGSSGLDVGIDISAPLYLGSATDDMLPAYSPLNPAQEADSRSREPGWSSGLHPWALGKLCTSLITPVDWRLGVGRMERVLGKSAPTCLHLGSEPSTHCPGRLSGVTCWGF